MSDYTGAKIVNIKRGKGERACYIYAQLVASDGTLLINATLDYIFQALQERVPEEQMVEFDAQLDEIRAKGI